MAGQPPPAGRPAAAGPLGGADPAAERHDLRAGRQGAHGRPEGEHARAAAEEEGPALPRWHPLCALRRAADRALAAGGGRPVQAGHFWQGQGGIPHLRWQHDRLHGGLHQAGRCGASRGPLVVVRLPAAERQAAARDAAAGLLAALPRDLLHARRQRPGGAAPRRRGPVRPHLLPRGRRRRPRGADGRDLRGGGGQPEPAAPRPRLGRAEAAVPPQRGERRVHVLRRPRDPGAVRAAEQLPRVALHRVRLRPPRGPKDAAAPGTGRPPGHGQVEPHEPLLARPAPLARAQGPALREVWGHILPHALAHLGRHVRDGGEGRLHEGGGPQVPRRQAAPLPPGVGREAPAGPHFPPPAGTRHRDRRPDVRALGLQSTAAGRPAERLPRPLDDRAPPAAAQERPGLVHQEAREGVRHGQVRGDPPVLLPLRDHRQQHDALLAHGQQRRLHHHGQVVLPGCPRRAAAALRERGLALPQGDLPLHVRKADAAVPLHRGLGHPVPPRLAGRAARGRETAAARQPPHRAAAQGRKRPGLRRPRRAHAQARDGHPHDLPAP
mmetsp:Transcript_111549/g.360043  ORF Transcript_111549/g.360043 Transcript_111549/m.360043 type:complete len:552 (+) Transcript_111549:640-2295(+)